MILIEKLKPENASKIVSWCQDKDADFLMQWAGRGYIYPLTEKQIFDRVEEGALIFEAILNGEMIGTIELLSEETEEKPACIGRFVLEPSKTGAGLGTEVMQAFLKYCKEELTISRVILFVFDFNVGAYKCYQKCGFIEEQCVERPNGWKAIRMAKKLI